MLLRIAALAAFALATCLSAPARAQDVPAGTLALDDAFARVAAAWEAVGMDVIAACPEGYDPPAGTPLELTRDPREAARGADVLVTDIWVSLGQEATRAERLRDLEPYRLDDALLELAAPDAIVLHCLPAHPGEEITPEVLYGPRSAVWDEAENRLHAQKALLALLIG